ncbi:MAG: ABC transporter ATP-binding protein [Verrucomicrobiales bacterium]|jgi:ABC-2 type transport system ATP-binding protein|nr:ABC transporter ATP-binding protein [Verrucomicrobiales bacterium]
MSAMIETENLSRRFRGHEAVDRLSLSVPAGSVYAFLGRNGAGKTTTIKMLAGLLSPSAGAARVLGCDARRLTVSEWRQIGYVSENQRLYEWMTGAELLAFTAKFYPSWDDDFAARLAGQLALPLNRKLKHCSRGEKMKTALLLAIAFRPRLLILDEPFSGLDALVREEFLASLLELTRQNEWTIFFSSHDIDEVERLADHVGMIDAGRLTLSESLESLQRRCRRVEIFGTSAADLAGEKLLCRESTERGLRLVHADFSERTEAELRRRFADATVEITPLSLKEIFIAHAKTLQGGR